jgi:hypothetical protein
MGLRYPDALPVNGLQERGVAERGMPEQPLKLAEKFFDETRNLCDSIFDPESAGGKPQS